MNFKKMSNIKQRLAVSFFGVIVTVIAIYFSSNAAFKPIFTLILASIVSCALWEYYQIGIAKGFTPLIKLGMLSTFCYTFGTYLVLEHFTSILLPQVVLALSFVVFCSYFLFKSNNPLNNLALTSFGIIYLTIPLTLILNINFFFNETGLQDGRWWLFYLITVTKMTDTGAYFFGKKFGKHKLAPDISPKKTIEGSVGGLVLSIIVSLIFYYFCSFIIPIGTIKITLFESLILGALIGIIAQIGDLVESLLKRDGGIKDSNQLPGLGGILDIVDSLIFTTPIIYFFLKIQGEFL